MGVCGWMRVCVCIYIYMLQNNKDSKVKMELESKKMWFTNNPVDSFFSDNTGYSEHIVINMNAIHNLYFSNTD